MVEAALNGGGERLQPAAFNSVAAGVIPSWCTIKNMQLQQEAAYFFYIHFTITIWQFLH